MKTSKNSEKETHGTYQTPMRRQETVASSKHGQERAIRLHHLQFARSQRLSKNENHPALWVASFFTGPRCQSAMGLQWHERQRRLRSEHCERHPKKWTRNPKNTMRIAKHVLCWCPAKNAKKATCRCLLQSLVAHANKQELLKKKQMAHTKLQCAAKKLLHRPSMARRGPSDCITCSSPDPKGFPRMKIIRRFELPASLLENVAKAPWGFNGMNVKADFAVAGAKDTQKSGWLGIPKLPCGLPNMSFAGAPQRTQRKLPVDACSKP